MGGEIRGVPRRRVAQLPTPGPEVPPQGRLGGDIAHSVKKTRPTRPPRPSTEPILCGLPVQVGAAYRDRGPGRDGSR